MLSPALVLKITVVSELLARHAASADPDPDFSPYYKSTTQMAHDKGVNVSRHEVRTEDGYWLTLHRVGERRGTPVLLVHGLLAGSDQWLLLGRAESYALVLADAGFDVWMANTRGNVYSRRHDTLSPDLNNEYWNFSLHEIGYYDLPAMIDHIRLVTGHDRVFYSGYSVGGTLFFIMTASRPEYNQRVLGAFLLAPLLVRPQASDLSPVIRMGFDFIFAFVRVLKDYQVGEFYPRQADMLRVKEEACKTSAQTFPLCVRMLQKPFGLMPSQYDVKNVQYLLKSFGSGTSTKVIEHIMQIIQSGRLRQFNYSPLENLVVYGSYKAPEYDISRTSCPVVLHYDKNDYIIDYKAVELAAKKLPCLFCNCMGNQAGFSHFGYIISNRAAQFVFRKVVRNMRLLETEALTCS